MEFKICDTIDVIAYDIRATFNHPDYSSKLVWGTMYSDDEDNFTATVRAFRELWNKHNPYGHYHELVVELITYFEIENEILKLTWTLKGDGFSSDEELYNSVNKKAESFRGA